MSTLDNSSGRDDSSSDGSHRSGPGQGQCWNLRGSPDHLPHLRPGQGVNPLSARGAGSRCGCHWCVNTGECSTRKNTGACLGDAGRGSRGRDGPNDPNRFIYKENVPAQLSSQLHPQVLKPLIKTFKAARQANFVKKRPLRPGYGTNGSAMLLRANFFVINLPKQPIYSYRLEVSPNPNGDKTRLFYLLEQAPRVRPFIGYLAHDRDRRLVSAKKLPQPMVVSVPYYDDNKSGGPHAMVYTVSFEFDREFDPNALTSYMEGQLQYRDYDPLPLISALNLVLQRQANNTGVRCGKNRYFFPSDLPKGHLSENLDAVRGFFCSVRPAFGQLLVNINVCVTAFVKPGCLADKLLTFNQLSVGGMLRLPKSMLKSIKVRVLHLNHKKKLFAIGSKNARDQTFNSPKYGRISVEQYFAKEYGWPLEYATELPVVNVGSDKRPIWLPAELCKVEEGNAYLYNDEETKHIFKYARNKPVTNAERIVDGGLPLLGFNYPVPGFGITIQNEMVVIPGRKLSAPGIGYACGQPSVQDGSWNILNVKFHRGANVTKWWVLVVQDGQFLVKDENHIRPVVEGLQQRMKQYGMDVPHELPTILPFARLPPLHRVADPERKKSLNIIRATLHKQLQEDGEVKPSFVLVFLENKDKYIYSGIKRIGDVEMGIHTVHMQVAKATEARIQDQYLSNIVLKVNMKLGGTNHTLDDRAMTWLRMVPTMMVGIDVTHPKDSSKGVPSVAAVVASVDDQLVQFPGSLRIQKAKGVKEILDGLQEMMVERLEVWQQKNNNNLPKRIFVYRDGVSEGQFDTVLNEELPQILGAFQRFSNVQGRKKYRPKLSIIICGKRHHAKFWPTKSKFADRNGNTPPGTVVDKGITGVFDFDFYLQAHAGMQGHVKATHYTVIYDENRLTADEVQQTTHDASYLYGRATRAVSIIPAAYYADLACERGRCYLNEFFLDDDRIAGGGSSKKGKEKKIDKDKGRQRVYEAVERCWGQGLHADIRGSMFYI